MWNGASRSQVADPGPAQLSASGVTPLWYPAFAPLIVSASCADRQARAPISRKLHLRGATVVLPGVGAASGWSNSINVWMRLAMLWRSPVRNHSPRRLS